MPFIKECINGFHEMTSTATGVICSCLQPKEITWSPSRVFPPVRACMFSSHLAAVTFLADPSAGGGLPRGTFIYATSPVPVQVRIDNHTAASSLNIW